MTTKLLQTTAFAIIIGSSVSTAARTDITPGQVWNDDSGKHINAHGGCVQFHDGKYYWFGEDRTGYTSNGISCYTSTDLYNWKRVGLALTASEAKDPETGKCTLERPKVVYNDNTEKWVMYIHWENGNDYGQAKVCVATSDKIEGPYTFVDAFRPNNRDSRDQTIFKDIDGKAYHFCATNMNSDINVALLTEDYLRPIDNPTVETQILKGRRLEAPAIIRVGDTYFGIFSECSGWDPNPGHYATSMDILGEWELGRNFTIDKGSETTYKSQSTYIFPVNGKKGAYVYMGDRWNSSDVGGKSEYVWLPLSVRSGAPTVKWYDKWDMSVFDTCDLYARISAPADGAVVRLLDKYSDRWVSTSGNGFYIDDDNTANIDFRLVATEDPYIWKLMDESNGKYLDGTVGALSYRTEEGSDTQLWRFILQEDGCYKIQNVSNGKVLTVSGSSTYSNTPVFLSKAGSATSQYFGLYFNTAEHSDYTKADHFSKQYKEDVAEQIEAQRKHDANNATMTVVDRDNCRIIESEILLIETSSACNAIIEIIDIRSGITCELKHAALAAGSNEIRLSQPLAKGVYTVRVSTGNEARTCKVIVR